MLTDAHAHFRGGGELAARRDIRTLYCGTDPETAARALALAGENAPVSCGLHPWQADRWTVSDMLPFIRRSAVLGEIGLDSVWTDVDMSIQRRAFAEQLDLAETLGLPVLLHTKGMEGEIARSLRPYGMRKLVHWYACDAYLDDYIEQGCWFTVGPDHAANPAVQQVLRRAPIDRILTETDGLDAVEWALGRPVRPAGIGDVLRGELRAIARAHGVTEAEAEAIVSGNFDAFVYGQERG